MCKGEIWLPYQNPATVSLPVVDLLKWGPTSRVSSEVQNTDSFVVELLRTSISRSHLGFRTSLSTDSTRFWMLIRSRSAIHIHILWYCWNYDIIFIKVSLNFGRPTYFTRGHWSHRGRGSLILWLHRVHEHHY